MKLITTIEKEYMKEKIPDIAIGDQVEVSCKIVEGDKERIQKFIGMVISKRGSGINANFTVRRIVQGEGTERTFSIHSPNIDKVEVVKSGKVRRAKLYYMRDKKGKEIRLKEKFAKAVEKTAPKANAKSKTKTETKPKVKAKVQESKE